MIDGDVWPVLTVEPGDPGLVDRTGNLRLATTDPVARVIRVSRDVVPPLLDKVILHEATHALTMSRGLLWPLRNKLPESLWVTVEEWSAELLENHGIEAIVAASESLGRPLCVEGTCMWYH